MSTTLHKYLTGVDLHVNKVHADTHVVAGTDPLTLAESQVTDLPANLADLTSGLNGKAPTDHVHVRADITDFPVLIPGTGNGDVVGPVVATPGNVATFADDSGKVVQDGGAIPTTLPASDVSAWAKEATKPSYSPAELGAEEVANKSVSVPTDAASDTKYPSVKAVKDYADGLVAGLLNYRGAYDASVNTYPATGGSGTAGAVMKGDMWAISVAGTLGGVSIQGGDVIIAKIDTPAQTAANWNTLNTNVSYVPEDQGNKENTALDTSTTKYPSNAIVKAAVDAKVASSTVSAAGAELINDANAAAQRATLGTAAYSEGTWTPDISALTVVGVAPVVVGTYKRIGNLVSFACLIEAGSGGNTSMAVSAYGYIEGLPFAISIYGICRTIITGATPVDLGSGFVGGGTGTRFFPQPFTAKVSELLITGTYFA